MKKYFMMARFVPAILIGFFWMQLSVWAEGPLVIVVHGVGGGNRPAGWANETRDAYKIPPANWVEVNFNLAGRDEEMISTVDFAHQAGEWASQVQKGIMQAVKAHPGQKIMIVSHSWGTITTSIALNGGAMPGAELNPIQLEGRRIARWVTLGSPLGRADSPKVAPNLRQLHVQVSTDKPAVVDAWANIYDRDDPVSMQSHNLPSAENLEVSKSGAIEWVKRTLSLGLTTHTAIWLHPTTIKLIQQYYRELEQSGTGRISVKVIRKKDNFGVVDARVVAILRGGANSAASTDKQGDAIFEAIPIGSYVIEATPLTGAGLKSGRASIELHDGERASLTVTLEEGQQLTDFKPAALSKKQWNLKDVKISRPVHVLWNQTYYREEAALQKTSATQTGRSWDKEDTYNWTLNFNWNEPPSVLSSGDSFSITFDGNAQGSPQEKCKYSKIAYAWKGFAVTVNGESVQGTRDICVGMPSTKEWVPSRSETAVFTVPEISSELAIYVGQTDDFVEFVYERKE